MSNSQHLWQQAQRFSEQKRWDRAATGYKTLVASDPGFVPAWIELSLALEKLGEYRESRAAALRAASFTDGIPPGLAMMVARRLRRYEEIGHLRRYIRQTQLPNRVPAEMLIDLAAFLSSAGIHADAGPWVERALQLKPNLVQAHNMRGLLEMFAGHSEAAVAAFERAITLQPDFAAAYSLVCRVARVTPATNHVDRLRRLLARPGISLADQVLLGYALHSELHDLGDYDAAWQALGAACRAKLAIQPYNHAEIVRTFDIIESTCSAEFVRGEALESPTVPIFIIGMYRSGTTLLERMLSGHPEVLDAGETYAFPAQMRLAANHYCGSNIDSTIASRIGGLDYREIGAGYIASMIERVGPTPMVTEKLNSNFIVAGLIAKAMPQAKLLHMRRDPADTCFSNLRTLFTAEAPYSYDQVHIADFYQQYARLMKHWESVLGERVLDVDYAQIVSNPQAESARVAAYCGLSFDPAMLDVTRDSGMVATASSSQVRQGIMANRGQAWRAYEKHLRPMLDRLAHHGLI